MLFQLAHGASSTDTQPVVAINVSEYTSTHWNNPAWTYVSVYRMLEEALKSDGTPFVEISDASIESGGLLASGAPKYPILFCLASECISDSEASQISSYATLGGYVYVGSSSWTKYADGSTRSNFALSTQMGLTCTNSPTNNWAQVENATRIADNIIVNHVPKNVVIHWSLPLTDHTLSNVQNPASDVHYAWNATTTVNNPAQILMTIDTDIMFAIKPYSLGMFIYHSELTPLASYGIYSPNAYEYMFFRQAIEIAFENQNVPLVKLSPWPYQYDSAFIVRHDMDFPAFDEWIASSAQAEKALGVTGQYYIVTGDVRDASNSAELISLIQQAQSLGAQIGSHNGGLNSTPWNPTLQYGDYAYYHWSPDGAMTSFPTGQANGMQYANDSIKLSLDDLQSWLGQRPDLWVSPNGQGSWEETNQILQSLGIKTSGEFTTAPYPNSAFSVTDKTKYYDNYVVPVSRWITSSGTVCQSIDELSTYAPNDLQALVDFYYNMGALVSPYSHATSASGLQNQFIVDALAKPYMWNTTPSELRDWGTLREQVSYTQQFQTNANGVSNLTMTLTGSASPNTALEVDFPVDPAKINFLQVLLNGIPTSNYRLTANGLKLQAGLSSTVTVLYSDNTQSGWTQTSQADFKSGTLTGLDADRVPDQLSLATVANTTLFSDDFSNTTFTNSQWRVSSGSWSVSNGYYNMLSTPNVFAQTYVLNNSWTNFVVEARLRYVVGQYPGAIGGRINPITGSRYTFLLYSNPDYEGPNIAALYRFNSWQDTTGTMIGEATVPTDAEWHTLKMDLDGAQIKCYYDGSLVINVVDNTYSSGSISFESFGDSINQYDWVKVTSSVYASSGTLLSSTFNSLADATSWNTISWTSSTPAGTNLQLRTRTAATQSGLSSAVWSNYYTISGSAVTSQPNRWIQYEASFTSNSNLVSPVLYGLMITYNYSNTGGKLYLVLHMDMVATVSGSLSPGAVLNEPLKNATAYYVDSEATPTPTPQTPSNDTDPATDTTNSTSVSNDPTDFNVTQTSLVPIGLGTMVVSTGLPSKGVQFKTDFFAKTRQILNHSYLVPR